MDTRIRRLLIPALLALVVLVTALALRPPVTRGEAESAALLLPELRDHLNDLTRIRISGGGDATTLERDGDTWVIAETYRYPAALEDIRKLLLHLSQSEIQARKTADPERLERIGLDDGNETRIELYTGDALLYDLRLGFVSQDMVSTYAKLGDDPQSYLISGQFSFSTLPEKWIYNQLFTIAPARIRSVAFDFEGKKDYRFDRPAPGERMQISPVPKGVTLKPYQIALGPNHYFQRLAFTDVLPESFATMEARHATITMQTYDGLLVHVTFYNANLDRYARFEAEVNPDARDESLPDLPSLKDVRAQAASINQQAKGWLFKLGQYQENQFLSSYDDLIETMRK